MNSILSLNHTEARLYFLKQSSYFSSDLPKYFNFKTLLDRVSTELRDRSLYEFYLNYNTSNVCKPFPSDYDDVNYTLLYNKDGKYAWRPLELVHPVLYVSLVHQITEQANWEYILSKFNEFQSNPKIVCNSIPIESNISYQSDKAATILNWWNLVEQQSIEQALAYEYVLNTDITDCYGSIYTHSIPWALHTKTIAKTDRRPSLIGNFIDRQLQNMSHGQTNGIPQGSSLMDFIAEIVLGYADSELTDKINENHICDYKIIRYRDDYRIFTNNLQDAELIAKLLTEVLIDLGLKLNPQKTTTSNDIIFDSIKPDKRYWLTAKNTAKTLQKRLYIIYILSQKHPNSGSLVRALDQFYKQITNCQEIKDNINVLIAILVAIMYKNPKVYSISSAILSKLLSLISDQSARNDIWDSILKKFDKIPNTGHLKIWLQRITIKIDRAKEYDENLCRKVNDSSIILWNSDWLNDTMKSIVNTESIIDEIVINEIDQVINIDEVSVFDTY